MRFAVWPSFMISPLFFVDDFRFVAFLCDFHFCGFFFVFPISCRSVACLWDVYIYRRCVSQCCFPMWLVYYFRTCVPQCGFPLWFAYRFFCICKSAFPIWFVYCFRICVSHCSFPIWFAYCFRIFISQCGFPRCASQSYMSCIQLS